MRKPREDGQRWEERLAKGLQQAPKAGKGRKDPILGLWRISPAQSGGSTRTGGMNSYCFIPNMWSFVISKEDS